MEMVVTYQAALASQISVSSVMEMVVTYRALATRQSGQFVSPVMEMVVTCQALATRQCGRWFTKIQISLDILLELFLIHTS